MNDFFKLLATAKQLEEQNAEVYEIYSEITDHFGLMQLLRALCTGIDTHRKALSRFLEHRAGEVELDETLMQAFDSSAYEVERSFDAAMEYRDFLCMIIQLEGRLQSFYESLLHIVLSTEHRDIFRRLAADQEKHLWLARSRLELENFRSEECS
ncbi:MAG: hypothetical protein EA428_14375 [Spirochaetaceae bacterium]|nr:MAG: hypothetical protein EA428_14375 [Spirochaetaceae bacterium]